MPPLSPLAPWRVSLAALPLVVVADPDRVDADGTFGYQGTYVSEDATKDLQKRNVPVHLNRFNRGCGIITRRDADDDGHMGWAKNGITWLGNGLYPSGKRTPNTVASTLSLSTAGTAIVDSRLFNGDRYCITTKGWVIKFTGDDPSATAVFSPALNAFGSVTTSLAASFNCTAIEIFQKASGEPALYVFAYNSTAHTSRVYEYALSNAGTHWVDSTTATPADFSWQIAKAVAPVWWEAQDAGGAQRMLIAINPAPASTGRVANVIRHVPAGSDPLDATQYVTSITTDPSGAINKLLAFPQFAFALTPNGIWTFNAIRVMNVTPYWKLGASYTSGSVATLYNGGIVAARGFGADFYDAGQAYRRQDRPYEVGPTAYFQDGIPVRGQLTAMVPYEQFLIQSLYNHENKTTYIGRSAPRDVLNLSGQGTWAQYWSEHTIESSAGVGQQVTHLVASSPAVSGGTVAQQRTVNLWMFTADEPFGASSSFALQYAPLSIGSGPLALQASGGSFSFSTSSEFFLTAQNWDDDLATKFIRRFDILSYLQSKTLALYTRADRNPATIDDSTTWTLAGSSTADSAGLSPSTPVSGKGGIGLKVILTTDNASIGPVFRAISPLARVVKPTSEVRYLWVVLSDDYELDNGATDLRDRDAVVASLVALQDQGPQTYIDEHGVTHNVYVEQGITYRTGLIEGADGMNVARTLMRLELSEAAG
jgi:hypothetical protein